MKSQLSRKNQDSRNKTESKKLRTITGNREQKIRISTNQKLCIPQYLISD